jgi:ABC-type transport system involved in cytochrome c biogenesis permease component
VSDQSIRTGGAPDGGATGATSSPRRGSPTWWLVFTRELADLWIGGRALILTLIYCLVLGVMVYVLAYNEELRLIPPKELVYELSKNAMAVSLFICLVVGADSLSGDRERATLESLLLTPTSRRQIVVGKFLAAISVWPVAFLITIPYMRVLSQGDEVLLPTIFWAGLLGTVLALGYTGLGMLASFWSGTNKTSYFVSLGLYVVFLVPAQLPGRAQTGAAGQFLQWINPLAATNHFLSKHLVNYRSVSEFWRWLESPVVFALLVTGLLFLYAAPGLRLEPGRGSRLWSRLSRRTAVGAVVGAILLLGATPTPAQASELTITSDSETASVKTGDEVEFTTVVTNEAAEASGPLIVAMNIINLDAEGDVVDPEDWSPERTQYIESLPAGESAELDWVVNTILDGDFMVYMVLIPEPETEDTTSEPSVSTGLHLTVAPYTRLNPGGILPYVIGGPVIVLAIIVAVFWLRRRSIDRGGAN